MRISAAPADTTEPWLTPALEVAGGVFTWDLREPPDADPHLQLWAAGDADWLWRIVGEQAHADTLRGLTAHRDVPVRAPGELALLHRLAWGHWLRRWWPASVVDGLEPLPGVVLDVEVAVLTAECEMYFGDDVFDGDPTAVLGAHDGAAVAALALHPRPDVRNVYRRWLDVETGEAESVEPETIPGHTGEYALAAGPVAAAASAAGIARGRASVPWESVPAHTFDAAENTITWVVDAAPEVVAGIEVALLPGRTATPVPIAVSLPDPPVDARATLDRSGRATIPLPLTATAAWRADWSALVCTVGGVDARGTRDLRDLVRDRVRARIEGDDDRIPLYVAEQIVADNLY